MYQFLTNWSDWLKNTLLLDVNCLAAQKRFAGTGCTKHENMSFMDISIFPSWFYWPGEESHKSESADNCHGRAGAASFKRETQGSPQHMCDPSIHYLCEQGRAGCLFLFVLPSYTSSFLLSANPAVWRPAHGSNDASCGQGGSPPAVTFSDRCTGWKQLLELGPGGILSSLSPLLCSHSPGMLGCGWPGGKDTDTLPHFKQLPPQGRCITADWSLGKWIRVNLAGLCCCCRCCCFFLDVSEDV